MIRYRGLRNWKYQLVESYELFTSITSYVNRCPFFYLRASGVLVIERGYCWDGPSGPTWDSANALRASLVHDVFYQLIRQGIIPMKERKPIDDLFRKLLLDSGMSRFRAWYYWKAVRAAGFFAASKREKGIETREAP